MDKLNNSEDAERFLQGLGLHIDEGVVRQVVNVLSGKAHQSLYSLYATRPDKPAPVCGKGSAYKIKKLYDGGELQPYLAYLSQRGTVDEEFKPIAGSKEIAVTLPPLRPPSVPPLHSAINIGDLKIAPSPIGTKLVEIGPPMPPWEGPPLLPAYANISIRLHVENPSDASITISGISYTVTINGNYAGNGSVPGVYTISPHSEREIDAPFRADFHTGGSVVISAIMSKELQIGLTGTAHYQSNSHSADKPFGGVISVTLQLPYHIS